MDQLHNKGPWNVAARISSNSTLRVNAEDGAKIADVLPSNKPGEQAARAALIAAAPELLEALQEIADMSPRGEVERIARAAIALAEKGGEA